MRIGLKGYLTAICVGSALAAVPALAAPQHGGPRVNVLEPHFSRQGQVHGGFAGQAPAQTGPRTQQFRAIQAQGNGSYRSEHSAGAFRANRAPRNFGIGSSSHQTFRGNALHNNFGGSNNWRNRGNFNANITNRDNRQYRFSHRNYSRFDAHERTLWRSGRWNRGRHDDRDGWWWTIGSGLYYYPQPIYPYPGYVSSYYYSNPYYGDSYYNDPYYGSYLPYAGDVPPANAIGGPPPESNQYWYYCRDPEGYYPYVRECRGRWEPVEPTPYDDGYDDGQ